MIHLKNNEWAENNKENAQLKLTRTILAKLFFPDQQLVGKVWKAQSTTFNIMYETSETETFFRQIPSYKFDIETEWITNFYQMENLLQIEFRNIKSHS